MAVRPILGKMASICLQLEEHSKQLSDLHEKVESFQQQLKSLKRRRKGEEGGVPKRARPMNAYMYWVTQTDIRNKVVNEEGGIFSKENPTGIKSSDVAKRLGELWKDVPTEERARFKQLAKTLFDESQSS